MIKKHIPNILTFANLSFGIFAIVEIMNNKFYASAICILISALIDRYDGVARFLEVTSAIGKELDSLADLTAFGVAPGMLLFCMFDFSYKIDLKIIGITCLILYVISGSYRLARYNADTFNGVYRGVPITVCGVIIALYSLIVPINLAFARIALVMMIILSYLMISEFKFKKI